MLDAVTLPRRKPLVLADLLPGTLVRDALLVLGAAGFVGALAQISIHLSFTPVPITGQTLGVLLAGTALGWKRGAAAMVLTDWQDSSAFHGSPATRADMWGRHSGTSWDLCCPQRCAASSLSGALTAPS